MQTNKATASPHAAPESSETSLEQFTRDVRKNRSINWYRSPIPPEQLKALHRKSDFKGAVQTGGFLALLLFFGTLTVWAARAGNWLGMGVALFLLGTVSSFSINAVHELGHGTVFKTKAFNRFFTAFFSFFGWINHLRFQDSHTRHHRYTLHPPDDLEVVLPVRLLIRHFLYRAILNPEAFWGTFKNTLRLARGKFQGEWEEVLYPASNPVLRKRPVRWAWFLLLGHGTVALVSVLTGWWIIPVVVSLAPFIGNGLYFFCNNTQHIGLQDNVADFRLCCRTFTLNPVVRFLYWQMNYHIEHHMYAAVPCYHLGELHRAIRHDLPPCAHGLMAVWKEIAAILAKQEADPNYQHKAPLPAYR